MAVDLYAMIGASRDASPEVLMRLITQAEDDGRLDQSFSRACHDVLLNAEKRAAYDARLLAAERAAAEKAKAAAEVPEPAPAADPTPITENAPEPRKVRPGKHCHACGEVIDREAVICVKCGVATGEIPVKKSSSKVFKLFLIILCVGFLASTAVPAFTEYKEKASGPSSHKMELSSANVDAVTDVRGLVDMCGILIGQASACSIETDMPERCGRRLDALTAGDADRRQAEISKLVQVAEKAAKMQKLGELGACEEVRSTFKALQN